MTSRVLAVCLLAITVTTLGCRRNNPSSCDGGACADLGITVGCRVDTDCSAGQLCVGGVCGVGCHNAHDCPASAPICDYSAGDSGHCVGCLHNNDCTAPAMCGPSHVCVTLCAGDSQCAAPTPKCDPSAHQCVACLTTGDCALGSLCAQNQCVPGCSSDRDCPPDAKRCDPAHGPHGGCVVCVAPSDCPAGQTCKNDACLSVCGSDTDCATGHCDVGKMVCVECVNNAQCPLGNVCKNDACVAGCSADRDCPTATPRCDVANGPNGSCVQCLGNGDCPGGTCMSGVCMNPTPPGMIAIPAGAFTMGDESPPDPLTTVESSAPQHSVTLSAYAIDKTEVTNDAYRQCVTAGACQPPVTTTQYADATKGNFPVVFVDYTRATAYCAWAGKRLPTEAEWEKAARGTDLRTYPWGATVASCTLGSFVPDSTGAQCQTGVVAVGSYPTGASFYGVLDMSGNAREWVYDWDAPYPSATPSDPAGPPSGSNRQTRGGSYLSAEDFIKTYARVVHVPSFNDDSVGFRCAKGPTPSPKAAPTAKLTATPTSGSTATTFTVDASTSTDPAGGSLQFRWKFGETGSTFGAFSTAKTATHKYAANGTYKITLEALSSTGYATQATVSVTVGTAPPPDMAGCLAAGSLCSADSDCCSGVCNTQVLGFCQ